MKIFRFPTLLIVVVLFGACLAKKPASPPAASSPVPIDSPGVSAASPTPSTPKAQPGELQVGQASGSYTARGQTVEVKYAYAGRAVRFSTESLVILLTDQPIPDDQIAEEIRSATLLEGEKLRGLEYVIDDNGMWVRFHPSQYQESSSNKIKNYSVAGDIVRGEDEGSGLSDKYSRSVKFVAAIIK
ncbi:MAG TPA: hypothetical protein VFD63_25030 [Pyrinomonadaceae bacterium]|nr:hypothetical protein [Pyrinomonadaceae bacterium]